MAPKPLSDNAHQAPAVVPGLMDLHTHLADEGQSADEAKPLKSTPARDAFIGARNARDTLRAGFTTVRDVGVYRGFADVALRDAFLRFEFRFEERPGGGSVVSQRVSLFGPNASEYLEGVAAAFGATLRDGMRAVRDRIDGASTDRRGPSTDASPTAI